MKKIMLCIMPWILYGTTLYSQQIVEPKWVTPYPGTEFAYSNDGTMVLQMSSNIGSVINTQNCLTISTLDFTDGIVVSGCFSQTGNKAAVAHQIGVITIWNTYTGELLGRLTDFSNKEVQSIVFCNNEKYILAKHNDFTVNVWDIETGKRVFVFGKGADKVIPTQSFDSRYQQRIANGDMIVTKDDKGSIKLWSTNTGLLIHELKDIKDVQYCTFTDDGTKGVCFNWGNAIVFNTQDGSILSSFLGIGGVTAKFSKKGDRLFLGDNMDKLYVVDVVTNVVIRKFTYMEQHINIVNFEPSQNGERVLLHTSNRDIGIWDVSTGVLLKNFHTSDEHYYSPKFFDDDSKLIIAEREKLVGIWDLNTWTLTSQPVNIGAWVDKKILVNKTGTHVLAPNPDYGVQIIDSENGRLLHIIGGIDDLRYVDFIFNSYGDKIAASTESFVDVYDLSGKLRFRTEKFSEKIVTTCFYNQTNKLMVSYNNNTIRSWDLGTGKLVSNQKLDVSGIHQVMISPDDKTLIINHSGNKVGRYGINDVEIKVQNDSVFYGAINLAFSSSGKYVVSSTLEGCSVHETLTGKRIFFQKGRFISIDGSESKVAVVSNDTATVWNLNTGALITSITEHIDAIWRGVLDYSGNRLLTHSSDNTVRLWNANNGKTLAILANNNTVPYTALFYNNDSKIITANLLGAIKSYEISDSYVDGTQYALPHWSECGCSYNDAVKGFAYDGSDMYAATLKGVIRSSDGGEHWFLANNGIPDDEIKNITAVKDTVYAGTASGLYYSGNKGQSWKKLEGVYGMVMATESFNDTLYISTGYEVYTYIPNLGIASRFNNLNIFGSINSIFKKDNIIYLATSDNGIVLSTDNGKHWSGTAEQFKGIYLSEAAGKENVVFTITSNGLIYRSPDGGISWNVINTLKDVISKKIYIIENTVFVTTGSGVFYSNDNGELWEQYPGTFPYENSVSSLMMVGKQILLGMDLNGIHVSNDNGFTWVRTGYRCRGFYDFDIVHNTLFGYSNDETWKSIDSSKTWSRIIQDGRLHGDSNYIFKFRHQVNQVPLRSTDNGESWKVTNRPENVKYIYDFLYYNRTLYLATNKGVSISFDFGETWSTIAHIDTSVYSLSVTENTVFARYFNSGGYYTSDSGKNWHSINIQYSGKYQAFFNADNSILAGTEIGFLVTTNGGNIWKPVGLRRYPIIGPVKVENFIVFGNGENILFTDSSGDIWYNWVDLHSEVLNLKRNGNTLYALTRDRMWKTDISILFQTTGIDDKKYNKSESLLLFPNPASSAITVQMQTDMPYTYIIINQLGETVQAGTVEENGFSHQVSVSTLSSGAYTFITRTNGIIHKQMFSVIK